MEVSIEVLSFLSALLLCFLLYLFLVYSHSFWTFLYFVILLGSPFHKTVSVFPSPALLLLVHCNYHSQMTPKLIRFSSLIKLAENGLGSYVMNVTNTECTFDYVISKMHKPSESMKWKICVAFQGLLHGCWSVGRSVGQFKNVNFSD